MKPNKSLEIATLAGGCFWCIEAAFAEFPGVVIVKPGYMGGHVANPTYQEVVSGNTGHREVAQIEYDPSETNYHAILEHFFKQIDPTDVGGQFSDRGHQYTTAIYTHSQEQAQLAKNFIEELEDSAKFDEPIATTVLPAETFYEAEDYHHEYYKRNPDRYELYKAGSGRAGFINKHWQA